MCSGRWSGVPAACACDETKTNSGEAEAALQDSERPDGENTCELGMAAVQDMATSLENDAGSACSVGGYGDEAMKGT